MSRYDTILTAYRILGKDASFYDGMITCSTLPGRAVCGLVWNMGRKKNAHYLEKALSGIPYVKGENRRTDWLVEKLYTPKGFFTPPYETAESLRQRLERQYQQVTVETVEAIACFVCKK